MRARTAAILLSLVLVFYLAGCLWKGTLALYNGVNDGSPISALLGASLLVFGGIGAWFLVREIQFGLATERLAIRLDDAGELGQEDLDALPRSPGGRIDRSAADTLFARRKAETEAAPDDWGGWYRLAAAYYAAKDAGRARGAMRNAIRLATAQDAAAAGAADPTPAGAAAADA